MEAEEREARLKHKMALKAMKEAKKAADIAAQRAKYAEKAHMEAKMRIQAHKLHVAFLKKQAEERYREEDRVRALKRRAAEIAAKKATKAALRAAFLAKIKEKMRMNNKIKHLKDVFDHDLINQKEKWNKLTAE